MEHVFQYQVVPPDSPHRLRGALSMDQLVAYISRMRDGKAVGFDQFHVEFLKNQPDGFLKLLLHWINMLLEGRTAIDEYWLFGQIKFLFKGKEPA
eukprot:1559357-Rhodomonas_salina.1